MDYIRVADDDNEQDPIELPVEEDGTMLLSTVSAQFPGACGLKYRNQETGSWRGLRMSDGRIQAPGGMWENTIYLVVYPKGTDNKRKGDESSGNPAGKTRRLEVKKNQDLVVLGLPWRTTEEELKTYFEQFGEVVFSELKDKCTDLSCRIQRLEGSKQRSHTLEQTSQRSEKLSIQRTENSLETLHQLSKQFYGQIETLRVLKSQQGYLNDDSLTSFELSVALLDKCFEHLRAPLESVRSEVRNAGRSPTNCHHSHLNTYSNFSSNPGPSSYRHCNTDHMSNGFSPENGKNEYVIGRSSNSESVTQGSRLQMSSEYQDYSGANSPTNSYEDDSWLECESSANDSLATLSARIKALVSSPKWNRLYYRNGASEMARSLAHILYTREELILSTVTGRNGFDALDNVKLMAIREAVEKKYSQSAPDFEQLWKQCVVSLGQHCKYLRQKGGLTGCSSTNSQIQVGVSRCRPGSEDQQTINLDQDEPHVIVDLKVE